ncbi:MAG: sigma-70 family RNA polymerase sigma factor, partial [Bryobacteraceae bacterium]|nr:sigma-70 family RNA polymerase sigma factor [Bryobacteraceae bacterium]
MGTTPYWYPVYAFIRRWGANHNDAEDLTQAFFAYLYEHQKFGKADRTKGKFRTYILNCLTNFMADDYDRRTAAKRGGKALAISFNSAEARTRYERENVDDLTP